jgi:hypothetical protein
MLASDGTTLGHRTDDLPPSVPSHGWFKAIRSDEALELLHASKNAFLLLYVIAYRAQWKKGFNRYHLQPGEALLGDHKNYGLSAREYRTAKKNLEKWNFATFKATNNGTIAKLINANIFSVLNGGSDNPNDTRQTSGRRTPDKRVTATKNENNAKEGKLAPAELILRQDELKRVEAKMKSIRDSYDAHQSWGDDDRTEYKRLKTRKEELKIMLGFAV